MCNTKMSRRPVRRLKIFFHFEYTRTEAARNCPAEDTEVLLKLTDANMKRVKGLAEIQTKKYGHDTGHFTLKRMESSHLIGFIGEVGVLQYFESAGFAPPVSGLCPMGDRYDVFVGINGSKYKAHVKTGRWREWPSIASAFGVHWDQKIENSQAPVILVSFTRDSLPEVNIEGFVSPEYIGRCKVIEAEEPFPGQKYPSRCRNWLTYVMDFRKNDISGIFRYFESRHLWV